MSKFDTHGGYFSPDNYIRINEGGTHDENPNGGVQMGVDPEGVPNMVEEDETVYDDYVFSDNIYVDDAMVEKHNLPAWAKGKLYSKVTDRLVEEAEERPMDPISRSGLEEMLGRLRDAQEEQKQIQQERELEDELSQLSPEELDQLEAMLAPGTDQDGGVVGELGEQGLPPEAVVGSAEPVQQMPVEEMPMMRDGGTLLRRFDGGGGLTDEQRQAIIDAGPILDGSGVRVPSLLELVLGPDNRIVRGVNAARDWMENSTFGRVAGVLLPSDATQAFAAPVAGIATDAANLAGKIADYGKDITAAEKELAALKKELEVAKKTKVGSADVITSNIDKAKERIKFAKREMGRLQKQLPKAQKAEKAVDAATETIEQTGRAGIGRRIAGAIFDPAGQILLRGWRPTSTAGKVIKTGVAGTADLGLYGAAANGVGSIIDAYKTPVGVSSEGLTPYTGYYSSEMPEDLNFDDEPTGNLKACGGKINRYPDGGWVDFLNALNNYTVSRNPGGVNGTYRIDRRFPLAGFSDIKALEDSDAYRNFTDYVLTNSDNENVRSYLRALDAGTAPSVEKLFDGDNLKSNWRDLYNARRYDQKGGIYHFSGNDITALPTLNPVLPELEPVIITDPTAGEINGTLLAPPVRIQQGVENGPVDMNYRLTNSPTDTTSGSATRNVSRSPYYSTFPRYAGALTAGALGLYNAAMPADEYTIPRINPVLPQGQLHLRDPRYNPLDEEQAVNTVLAANAGTNRQIMNSGLGPSVGATLLASDYNAGRNIGTARQTVWDTNNQSRNAVNAAHNQNASALAGFDYGQSRDRAQILNDAAYRNLYNDLTRQRLNYDAEGQKYAAIQSSLDSVAQALSGMGQENSILNALNSNTALYHWLSPNRVAAYKAGTNESKDGGFLRKKKTKIENEIEQQVRDLSEYGETLTKVERDERKKREAQQKIDNLWSPASPSELKRVFSGRKKKRIKICRSF